MILCFHFVLGNSEIATKNVSKIKIKLTHRLVINLASHSAQGQMLLPC